MIKITTIIEMKRNDRQRKLNAIKTGVYLNHYMHFI
jgi:hypothetical protein